MPRCPSCFTPLTRVEQDDIKSAICGNCFGTWINSAALTRRARLDTQNASQTDDAPAAANQPSPSPTDPDSPQPPSLIDLAEVVQTSNSTQMLRCAQCEKPMEKDRFHPMIPVQVDRCRPCGYLWLDAGEMALLRRLYSELMTSTDPEIVRRRDRVGATAAEWQGRQLSQQQAQSTSYDSGTNDAFDLLGFLLAAAIDSL